MSLSTVMDSKNKKDRLYRK